METWQSIVNTGRLVGRIAVVGENDQRTAGIVDHAVIVDGRVEVAYRRAFRMTPGQAPSKPAVRIDWETDEYPDSQHLHFMVDPTEAPLSSGTIIKHEDAVFGKIMFFQNTAQFQFPE